MKIEKCVLITPETSKENLKLLDLHLTWFALVSGFYTYPTYVCDLEGYPKIEKELME